MMKQSMIGLAMALLAATTVAQQPRMEERYDAASVAWLKAAYLRCDQAMSSQRVDAGIAQRCSIVAEQLQRRGFGGDFAQLIEWWKSERRAAAPDTGDRRVSF